MWNLLIPAVTSIIEKVIPDPAQAADAKLRALELAQKGDLAALDAELRLALEQIKTNQVEAQQDNFRGGWRPATGWVCVAGLCYQFIVQPILPWLIGLFGATVPALPAIDNETLLLLLTGMLGLSGLRTVERVKGKV